MNDGCLLVGGARSTTLSMLSRQLSWLSRLPLAAYAFLSVRDLPADLQTHLSAGAAAAAASSLPIGSCEPTTCDAALVKIAHKLAVSPPSSCCGPCLLVCSAALASARVRPSVRPSVCLFVYLSGSVGGPNCSGRSMCCCLQLARRACSNRGQPRAASALGARGAT